MKLQCKIAALALSIIAFLASACSRRSADGDDRDLIVVSIEPQRYFLEQIAGDRFRIVTLMPGGSNPETFEPSVADRMDVDRSKIFFTTGFFPFENAAALTLSGDTKLVDTSAGIDLIYGTHDHGDNHSAFLHDENATSMADPHVWTSVRNARIICRTMADNISKLDPENAEEYSRNLARFTAHLDSLDQAFAARLASAPSRTFMVWHPTLAYFARDYGLEQIAVSSESKESSMKQLRQVIDEGRADSVKVFFHQTEYDSRQARAVADGIGATLVPLSPQSYDWEGELTRTVDAIAGS